jgi:uncharacterized cupredoxin-like copper-binding protein
MPLLPPRTFATVLRRTVLTPFATFAVLALTVAGCGSSDAVAVDDAAPVAIAMSEFKLAPQDVRVAAGPRSFEIRNEGTIVHRFELRGADLRRRLALGRPLRPGASETLQVELAPGSYVIRCAQERHNTLGEHGIVTVE